MAEGVLVFIVGLFYYFVKSHVVYDTECATHKDDFHNRIVSAGKMGQQEKYREWVGACVVWGGSFLSCVVSYHHTRILIRIPLYNYNYNYYHVQGNKREEEVEVAAHKDERIQFLGFQ